MARRTRGAVLLRGAGPVRAGCRPPARDHRTLPHAALPAYGEVPGGDAEAGGGASPGAHRVGYEAR
ncbi:hypothetical protein [Streptomyces lydicus]|uniref:hypothetical protein n=1 Tax=Streptomyces lydicus TaxID=47763 RepID=UPI0036FB059B